MLLNLSPLIYDVPGAYYISVKLLDDIDFDTEIDCNDWRRNRGRNRGRSLTRQLDVIRRYQTLSVSNLVLDWRHPALLAVVQALGHTVHASVEGHGRVPLTVQRDDQAGHLLVHFLWSLNRESREHVKELGGETQCFTCFLPKKLPQQPEHWAPV